MRRTDWNRQRHEQWVDRWARDLYRFACRLCGCSDLADDLVQETFYHAWRSIETLKDDSRARAWLFRVLRHRWSHTVRMHQRRPNLRTPLDAVADPVDDDATEPLESMAREELVRRALEQLSEPHRMVLLMVFVEGMTCQQAADELHVPLGTILSRIHRARQTMRKYLIDPETRGQMSSPQHKNSASPTLRLGGAE